MNIEEIEKSINSLEDTLSKLKELISDAKVCSSEITKNLIHSAIKRYASNISNFKIDWCNGI